MNPIRKSINAERAALKALIKNAQERLVKIDQFAALADDLFPEGASTPLIDATGALVSGPATVKGEVVATTKRDRILNTTEEILADGIWRDSRKLLPELEARGVEIGGNNPVNNLSAYLSAAKDRFETNREKGGWMIKAPKKAKAVAGAKDHSRDELLN